MNNYSVVVGQNTFEQTLDGKTYKVVIQDVKKFSYELIPTTPGPEQVLEKETRDLEEKVSLPRPTLKLGIYTSPLLDAIERGDFDELKSWISNLIQVGAGEFNLNRKDTVSSLTDKLIWHFYETAPEEVLKYTMDRIRAIINSQTPNGNYLGIRFTRFRNILKKRFGYESDIVALHKRKGQTREQWNERESQKKDSMEDALENRIEVDEKDALLIIEKMSASTDVYDWIITLQLATGARFIEAVRFSTFSESNLGPKWIHIRGVAKAGEEGKETEMDRPIFGLTSASEVILLACRIRDVLYKRHRGIHELDNDGITKLLVNYVNRRLKKLNIAGVTSSHVLRKLYAQMTYNLLPKEERKKMDRHLWIKRVLGHTSITTAANYSNVRVEKFEEKKVPPTPSPSPEPCLKPALYEPESTPSSLVQTGETILTPTYLPFILNTIKNPRGDEVQIFDRVSGDKGNAVPRCQDIMRQMHAGGIVITEALLRKFKIGSKTITKCADLKRDLNSKIRSVQ